MRLPTKKLRKELSDKLNNDYYLKSKNDVERRVRARGIAGDYLYYLTEKKKISGLKRIETERKLVLLDIRE